MRLKRVLLKLCAIVYLIVILFIFTVFWNDIASTTNRAFQVADDRSSVKEDLQLPLPTISMPSDAKFAYVFYATDENYFCHAMVNVELMINRYNMKSSIDIVILVIKDLEVPSIIKKGYCVKECYGNQVKIITVQPPNLSTDRYYKHCYVKLLSFSLYHNYSRIVFIDSDGLVLRNMDHHFSVDLSPFKMGATHAYWLGKWLTSVFFVADLSEELNENISQYLDVEKLIKIRRWNPKNSSFDMDVINYAFGKGGKVKLFPFDYARLDDFFRDPSNAQDWNNTYYVHFSKMKPFYFIGTKLWLENPEDPESNETPAFRRLFRIFWAEAEKVCKKSDF